MTLDLILPIASTLTALAADGGGPTLLPALTVLTLAVAAVLAVRLRRLQAALVQAQAEHAEWVRAREHQRSQREEDRGNIKQQLQGVERELRAQKKKNYEQSVRLSEAIAAVKQAQAEEQHAAQEAQRLRRDLNTRAEAHRPPAQAQPQAPAPAPHEVGAPPVAVAPEMVAPAAGSAVQPIDAADLPVAQGELQAPPQNDEAQALRHELEAANAREAERGEALQRACAELKETRQRLAGKTKRIEDLRRVDLMSRGKIEVLEDKLRRMGREYYEVVSALAQARGEVGAVPGPKPARKRSSDKPVREGPGSPEALQRAVPSRAAVTKPS